MNFVLYDEFHLIFYKEKLPIMLFSNAPKCYLLCYWFYPFQICWA